MKRCTSPLHSIAAVLATAPLVLAATAASAQDAELDMDLEGYIEPRCEFTSFSSEAVDFSVQDSGTIAFELYCNLAMSVTIESEHGALLHESLADRFGRLAEYERPYDAVLSLASGNFAWRTDSVEMQSGATFSTGDTVVFDTTGTLEINLRESLAGLKTHAGDYADTVSITLSPSLATFN